VIYSSALKGVENAPIEGEFTSDSRARKERLSGQKTSTSAKSVQRVDRELEQVGT